MGRFMRYAGQGLEIELGRVGYVRVCSAAPPTIVVRFGPTRVLNALLADNLSSVCKVQVEVPLSNY